MITDQGKLEAHDQFTTKDKSEMQVISLYIRLTNFGKTKPKILDLFIPVSIRGLENYIGREIIVPVVPNQKTAMNFNYSEDGRSILIQNDKGEFVGMNKRPESIKPGQQKAG